MEVLAHMNLENTEPVAAPPAKGKAGPKAGKAANKAPLGVSNVSNVPQTQKDGRRVEDIYQKKSQLEHILLRPDTYVGSVEKQTATVWVHNGEGLEQRTIAYVPALYKIFDEIIVNAIDNKVRSPDMATLKVDINKETGVISVMNDGAGIPVEMHSEEKVYVPELIFGHLLTSSNYDDSEKKVTGGRNGYGAKLANVFSTEFVIETCDGHRGKRYRQVFSDNMSKIHKPAIKECKATENWTKVSFSPDLAKFGMAELEEEICSLMRKRVFDAAGVLGKGVKVFLNGEKLPIKDFSNYVDMFLAGRPEEQRVKIYEKVNDRWEVCISSSDGQFGQVSYVNGICTLRGGTHVDLIANNIATKLLEQINKKNKSAGVKPFQIKNQLMVFVNALIENPAFDSQTKETLTSRPASFGSKPELSDDTIKKIFKSSITESVLSFAAFKQSKELKKNDGAKRSRLLGIPKLDDANDAGTKNSQDCTLILTEGDSAKALAISGLSVVGRDRYGVFPLRGKLLNVRDATHQQIMNNAEINYIKQILGLQHGKSYTDSKTLRYGHLMIMTDQDHDGSHIKGLLINFLHHFFPSLLKVPGFLVEFITPIIKVTKGKQVHAFYTLPEYDNWKEANGGNTKGWLIKYYKGLGTSTAAEAKQYFADLAFHRKGFCWETDGDGNLIEMAFSKKKVDERKRWLRSFTQGTFLDHSVSEVKYSDFINHELILFSLADLQRSIPGLLDGFKPGQRKILFSAFKRKLRTDLKVAQLAGYVAEHSAYHHGEASLMSTIVGLAQDFCGSNNINVFMPSGQFGTRIMGGKDHASPRYIFTRLAPLTRVLFPESDDQLLTYLDDDGQRIEPESYLPILPMVLVNGAEGIGTGWSTSIPNFNPRDIVANLRHMLAGEETQPMHPWYRGFNGSIVPADKGQSYQVSGIITQLDDTTLRITELPVRKWTQDYKEFLEGMVKPEAKDAVPFILDYKEHHTDVSVNFEVTLSEANMKVALAEGLHKKFKLSTTMSTTNMHLFNKDGVIQKYEDPQQILDEFFTVRLDGYEGRRTALINTAEAEMCRLDNKMRFILGVVKGDIKVSNRKKKDVENDLRDQGFDAMSKSASAGAGKKGGATEDGEEGGDAEDSEEGSSPGKGYDYLLSMPIYSLTMEKVQALCADRDFKQTEVTRLRNTTAKQMWADDLEAFLVIYEDEEEKATLETARLLKQQNVAQKNRAGPKGKAAKKKPKKLTSLDSDDNDDFSESDDEFMPKKKAAPRAAPKAKAAAAQKPVTAFFAKDTDMTAIHDDAAAPAPAVVAVQKGAASAKPKVAAAKPKAAAPVPAPKAEPAQDCDSEDDEPLSLMQRLAMRNASSVPAGIAMEETKPAVAAKAKAVPKPRAAAAKKKVVVDSDSELSESEPGDDDDDNDSDAMAMTPEVKAKKPAPVKAKAPPKARAAAATTKAKAPAKKQTVTIDSDCEDENGVMTPQMVKKTAPRATAVEKADVLELEDTPPKAAAAKGKTTGTAVNKRPLARKPAAKAEVVELDMDSMSEGPTPNPKKSKRKVASPAAAAAASTVGARPARAARATAKKPYVFDDSESEEEAGSEDWSGDSDEE